MRNDDKKVLYVLLIKHKKWLRKSIRCESRTIYDLNQMSKWSGIKNLILNIWQLIWITRKMWFESWTSWLKSCTENDSDQIKQPQLKNVEKVWFESCSKFDSEKNQVEVDIRKLIWIMCKKWFESNCLKIPYLSLSNLIWIIKCVWFPWFKSNT